MTEKVVQENVLASEEERYLQNLPEEWNQERATLLENNTKLKVQENTSSVVTPATPPTPATSSGAPRSSGLVLLLLLVQR
jgi:hypothetical protein